jgi:hypothetical protein
MRLMGAEVRPVYMGTATLKDATSEAIRDWVSRAPAKTRRPTPTRVERQAHESVP